MLRIRLRLSLRVPLPVCVSVYQSTSQSQSPSTSLPLSTSFPVRRMPQCSERVFLICFGEVCKQCLALVRLVHIGISCLLQFVAKLTHWELIVTHCIDKTFALNLSRSSFHISLSFSVPAKDITDRSGKFKS